MSDTWRFTDHFSGTLFARWHDQTLDSAYFRVLGVRDSAGVSIDYALTARDSLQLGASLLRYRSRWNDFLGNGAEFEGHFQRALLVGRNYEIAARYDVSYIRNRLRQGVLPARLQPLFKPDMQPATADLILPEQYGYTGPGLAISHGLPGDDYPQVGALRWLFDFGAGYVWPDGRFGYDVSGAVGMPVIGSDELSLSFGLGQTPGTAGGTAQTLGLRYLYFFGK
ncbi:MAG: hypothetical protein EPN72_01400 [Nevskiaceae bacterium]|nr:MAG: hypothetical protein EPN63_12150 [Nevskiaceae bacterium]TBR74707.1 MAG: hypothetical protein EPN72_01400 [Nevskiaceae bacterium]